MDYYTDKRRAYMRIYSIIDNSRKTKTEIHINKMILDLTNEINIGEKTILKRINLIQEVDNDFDIIEGVIVFK